MGSASQRANPVMASVLRDLCIAMDSVAVHSTIMNAMEHAPKNQNLAMESVLRDMLNVKANAGIKKN